MATPCCPKCESTSITYTPQSFAGIPGVLIHCSDCGAIITWTRAAMAVDG